jgi:hypothetical protein
MKTHIVLNDSGREDDIEQFVCRLSKIYMHTSFSGLFFMNTCPEYCLLSHMSVE